MVNQQELQRKVNELQALQNEVEVMQEEVNEMEERIQEHEDAKETINEYMNKEEGSEMLVPIGANTYLHAQVTNTEEVLIKLGADISAKRDIEKASEILDRRQSEIKENKEELENEIEEISQEAQELENEVRREYQQLQQQGQMPQG